jgi:saccharopine dehydrogenase-like NADP-dependent oxidoreductase
MRIYKTFKATLYNQNKLLGYLLGSAKESFNHKNSQSHHMKAIVFGCGNIGSVAAKDLAESMSSVEVVVADKDKARAKAVSKRINRSNVSWAHLDVADHAGLVKELKNVDLAMGFLPGKLGIRLVKACIDAGKNLVDVSYMPENPLTLNDEAISARVTIVPDFGFAPGISNLLIGHAVTKLDKAHGVHILVGGLPEKPIPPLGYIVTWSPEGLIDAYTRKARIVRKGRKIQVEALSGLEQVDFPGVGRLEAFFTDGLRSLPETIRDADDMWEKTLRYPGHAEKVRLLRALGFFEERRVVGVDGVSVSPSRLTAKLFERKLWMPKVRDIVALKVEVSGVKQGGKVSYVYHLLDYYDVGQKVTAMARTTAYPASIVAQLILKKAIKEKGVVPPEKIGMDGNLFDLIMDGLEEHGVRVSEEKIAG